MQAKLQAKLQAGYRTTDTLNSVPSAPADMQSPVVVNGAAFEWPGGRGVADIDLTVERGEIVALLGPNGAGKSTILKMLSGEIMPDSGELAIFGEPHSADARRRIGLVLQEPSTDDLMTLQETLELHGRLFGLRGSRLRERCAELLDSLGLGDRSSDACETLSGGLRRRLDIARALLHEPDLLLLDEPTLALDPESSAAIWETLHERASSGAAVVVCSNDTVEAERHADRVAIVADGRIAANDTAANLTAQLRSDALELDWPAVSDDHAEAIRIWDGVGSVLRSDDQLLLSVDNASEVAAKLFQQYGDEIRAIRIRESSLRDAWFQIVGRPLTGSDDD